MLISANAQNGLLADSSAACSCSPPLFLAPRGSQRYSVYDGRKVDEALPQSMQHHGAAERSVGPSIVRSAALKVAARDVQWELLIAVATSDGWSASDRAV